MGSSRISAFPLSMATTNVDFQFSQNLLSFYEVEVLAHLVIVVGIGV